jgi:hypothetical protein
MASRVPASAISSPSANPGSSFQAPLVHSGGVFCLPAVGVVDYTEVNLCMSLPHSPKPIKKSWPPS